MLREIATVLDQLSEVLDLFLIGLAFYITTVAYQMGHTSLEIWPLYFLGFLAYFVFWVIGSKGFRIYQSRRSTSFWRESKQMLKAHFVALTGAIVVFNLWEPALAKTKFLYYFSAYAVILTMITHLVIRLALQAWRRMGKNKRYVLILGGGIGAEHYLRTVVENPQSGYEVIGYLAKQRNPHLGVPYFGDYAELEAVLSSKVIDSVVVAEGRSEKGIRESLDLLVLMGKHTSILLDDVIPKASLSKPLDFGRLPMVIYAGTPRRPWHEVLKRLLDIVLTTVGLVALSPLMLGIALAIKVTSKGPAIFAQERVGINGRTFKCYKFRSMVVNAEELKARLAHLNEMSGPVFKIKNDPRITAIGGFIRKTSLDELPQLWNVLKGDMSLVGPRPPLPNEVNLYDPKHRKRLAVRPGITCIWQISGRNEVDFEEWMKMDADYVDRWSLWLDVEILAKTVPVVLLRKGAS